MASQGLGMTGTRLARLGVALLLGSLATACGGGAASDPADTSQGLPAVAAQEPPAGRLDEARIRAFVDSIYTRNDVRYSFVTKFGEDIDCIDFEAQPAVKALRAAGHDVPVPATESAARIELTGPLAEIAFSGQPDINGHPRECPDGTVPYLRPSPTTIANAAMRAAPHLKSGPPSRSPAPPGGTAGFQYVTEAQTVNNHGGGSTMSVYTPGVDPNGQGHSLSEVWTFSGSGESGPGTQCTVDCIQSVEVGWHVDDNIEGDFSTHLFIFSTQDGYWATGCYNLGDNNPNFPAGTCATYSGARGYANFVVAPKAAFTPGQILSSSTIDQPAVELAFGTENQAGSTRPKTTGWAVTVNGAVIGYYPPTIFHGSMQSTADTFEAGGEVYNTEPNGAHAKTRMGSGVFAAGGLDWASYNRGLYYLRLARSGPRWALTATIPAFDAQTVSDATCYSYDDTQAAPPSQPTDFVPANYPYFYFGGPGPHCSRNSTGYHCYCQ